MNISSKTFNSNCCLLREDSLFKKKVRCPAMSLQKIITSGILVSPDTLKPLSLDLDKKKLFNKHEKFSFWNGSPLLYPKVILKKISNKKKLPLKFFKNPICQYFLLSQIKQKGSINAPLNSKAAKKVHYRTQKMCKRLNGSLLDIGSDNPKHSRFIFPKKCSYLGLDPFCTGTNFRIIALGEILPFKSESFNNVVFNTSLDHILDFHSALSEAHRVLKQAGILVINTYVWLSNASLLSDTVHFHHFRESELLQTLEKGWQIMQICRYECPKKNKHRFNLVLKARKKILT